jgi:hypothetical protein
MTKLPITRKLCEDNKLILKLFKEERDNLEQKLSVNTAKYIKPIETKLEKLRLKIDEIELKN